MLLLDAVLLSLLIIVCPCYSSMCCRCNTRSDPAAGSGAVPCFSAQVDMCCERLHCNDIGCLSDFCLLQVYVQDLILQEGEVLWKLFEAGAYVYVCGDARKMVSSGPL